ncbi:1-(5-phosphoribosyl)-5-[(5-phosphoribosylamino)methylideneamino]imidazole-4-carboxamide isomerase [soil metagenome]
MIVYPAIDIREGHCVRLVEGDFARETVFGDNPAEMAQTWESDGASWIHVVDLDGAKAGSPQNAGSIMAIRAAVTCSLQVGGGIRTGQDVERYLDAGIDRVVLGTKAIHNPDLISNLAATWGERIAAGLDARNGKLAGSAWIDQTDVDAIETAARLRSNGVSTFVYTDISRDGTLSGPNLPALQSMVETLEHGVIASGGIGALDDVKHVRITGACGVIIGRALYDGRLSLPDAIRTAS